VRPRPDDERGLLSIQFVLATGLSLVLFVMLANLIVYQYGRGVVRAALDEGTRRGSRASSDPIESCNTAVLGVLGDLAGGSLGRQVAFAGCSATDAHVEASAAVTFQGWLPTVPDWSFTARARAVREREPEAEPDP